MSKGFQAFRRDFGPWIIFARHMTTIIITFIPFIGSIANGILPSMIKGLGMRLIDDRHRSDIPTSFGAIQPELNQSERTPRFGGSQLGPELCMTLPIIWLGSEE